MKRLWIAVVLGLAALPAFAQQPDPAQAFAKEWGTVQANDILAASSHEHVAELAQKLVGAYQAQRDEVKKFQTTVLWWEQYGKGADAEIAALKSKAEPAAPLSQMPVSSVPAVRE